MPPPPSAQDDTQPRDVEMGDGPVPIEIPTHRPATPDNERRAVALPDIQLGLSIAEVAAELAGLPYAGLLVKYLTAVFQAVERAQVNKEQWKLLKAQCVMILRITGARIKNNGQEHYPYLEEGIQNIKATLKKIDERARYYNEMSGLVAFFRSQAISDEIQGLSAELESCLKMFSFAANVALEQWADAFRKVQAQEARDIEQVKARLTELVASTSEIHSNQDLILNTLQQNHILLLEKFQQLLSDKSTVLQDQSKTTYSDYVDAQQIVRTILSVTKLHLPPKLLLGRQCIPETPFPVKSGITCDIFRASFLGGEKVAKKVFRLGASEKEYVEKYAKRFMRIAALWYDLRSDYTLPFYGVGMEAFAGTDHFQLYMVSPFMENSDAVTYLKQYRKNPGMKKSILRIITNAAQGLQYLHNRRPPVVHSGMRGDNVLITDSGGAVLGGFGLTKALENDENSGLLAGVMTGKSDSQRWMAPEMLDAPLLTPPIDVWSWAMTALEIISGAVPYNKIRDTQPMSIMKAVEAGPPKIEDHPEFNTYAYRPTEMWELLEECWKKDPKARLDMNKVVARLNEIAEMPEEST